MLVAPLKTASVADAESCADTQTVMIQTDKRDAGVLSDARSILLVHRPGQNGLCLGCYEFARTFAWFPCLQARWAQLVIDGAPEGRP